MEEVEKELERRQSDRRSAPTNSLKLGVRELKKLAKDLKASISRATGRLAELDALITWGDGNGPLETLEFAPEAPSDY